MPILPTPFFDDEAVDIDSLIGLLAFAASAGVSGVTILGVLGEVAALSDNESRFIVEEACAAAALPVIVGAGRFGVHPTKVFIDHIAAAGAAAAMVAPPSIDGASEAVVFNYFEKVADGSPIPIVVQDHPASSRVQLPVSVLGRLIDEVEQVVGVKCESVPTAPKVRAIKALTARVPVLTGLGALYAGTDLAAGADGLNTGFAFPEMLVHFHRLMSSGASSRARALYKRFLPLIVFEQHPGPAIRKEVWRRRGLLTSPRVRAPGAQLDPWMAEELTALLAETVGEADLSVPLAFS